MFPLMFPLIGAGIGAISNRKNPLSGAVLGGGLGALGGAAAPSLGGLFGSAAPAVTPAATEMGPFMPVPGAPLLDGNGKVIQPSEPAGLLGLVDKAKPIGTAFSAAGATGLLGGGDQPMHASAPPQTGGGGELAQLYQSIQQGNAQATQAEMQSRAKQQELLKRFGGGYGAA